MINESVYLQRHFVELSECEDSLLHHIDTFVLQQHVQVGNQFKQELVVPLTVKTKTTQVKNITFIEQDYRELDILTTVLHLCVCATDEHLPCFLNEANDKLSYFH